MNTTMDVKCARRKRLSFFDIMLYSLFTLFAIITIYPFYDVIIVSFANTVSMAEHSPYVLPFAFDLTGYKTIFDDSYFLCSVRVSLFVTTIGVFLSMLLSIIGAYVLSKKYLIGRRILMGMVLFSMLFGGGLIPSYLVNKSYGLVNNIFSMILPVAISTYNMIIMKNYFLSLPESLLDAAKIDGAWEGRILVSIIIPLSMPIIATFSLFYAVDRWNEWGLAIIYISKRTLYPLQIYLREILISATNQLTDKAKQAMQNSQRVNTRSIQMATIVVTTLPILCVYPFVQRHFVKGVMLGGIKE